MAAKKDWTVGDLLRTSSGYWWGCSLQAAVRLGVFTIIDGESLTFSEISEKIESDERGTEYLLNALTAMGLLLKEKGKYSISTRNDST